MKTILIAAFLVLLSTAGCSDGRMKSLDDWNRTEKGAAIGGTSGAVLGGIVGSQSGHTGTGALIGGAAGAGAGALIGNELDDNARNDWNNEYRHRRR